MSYIEFTENKDDLDTAATEVRKMIRRVENAKSRGGFDDEVVLDLIMDWTETGKIARGDGYWTSTRMVWKMTFKQPAHSKGTSQELLERLKRLDSALTRQTDIQVRFDRFNEVEEAMLRLVSDYRTALRQRNLAQLRTFDGQVAVSLVSLGPDYYKELGD